MTFRKIYNWINPRGCTLNKEGVLEAIKHVKPIGYDKARLECDGRLVFYYKHPWYGKEYMSIPVYRIGCPEEDSVYCHMEDGKGKTIIPIEELDERILAKFYENPLDVILRELVGEPQDEEELKDE